MKKIEDFRKHLVLMLEAGFIAVNQQDEDSALKLFKAAALLSPESTLSKVGIGYLHLHKLELKQACKAFEEVLEKEPTNDMARAFLGLSMTMTTDKVAEGERILTETQMSTNDEQVKTLAASALDFVDQFVKKTPKKSKSSKSI